MEFYSSIKKNEIILFTRKSMELEIIMLSEIVRPRNTSIMWFVFLLCANYKKKKDLKEEEGLSGKEKGARREREGKQEKAEENADKAQFKHACRCYRETH
jgi:hypothetical protein